MGSTSIEDGVKGIEADLFSSPESPATCDIGGKICTPISSSGGVRSFDLTDETSQLNLLDYILLLCTSFEQLIYMNHKNARELDLSALIYILQFL